jgi:hypothetical protein
LPLRAEKREIRRLDYFLLIDTCQGWC